MKFEKLNDNVITANEFAQMFEEIAAEGGTVIETWTGLYWRKDGTDDKVPLPS